MTNHTDSPWYPGMPLPESAKLFIDLETSGLYPGEAVILQIGAIMEWSSETYKQDLRTMDLVPEISTKFLEFDMDILPTEEEWSRASEGALKVNGLTMEILKKRGQPADKVRDAFINWLYEFEFFPKYVTVVGQNVPFDLKFLRHFWGIELDWLGFPFKRTGDTIVEYRKLQRLDPTLRGKVNQKAMSLALGTTPEDDVHQAIEGARNCQRNYWEIRKRLYELNTKPGE